MKKMTLITAIAMTLSSTAVLAEQGSGELNQIIQPSSSANYSTDSVHLTPADLPLVNGDAKNNTVVAPSSHINHSSSNEDQVALSDLPHRNAS